jgi:hypothetical protein
LVDLFFPRFRPSRPRLTSSAPADTPTGSLAPSGHLSRSLDLRPETTSSHRSLHRNKPLLLLLLLCSSLLPRFQSAIAALQALVPLSVSSMSRKMTTIDERATSLSDCFFSALLKLSPPFVRRLPRRLPPSKEGLASRPADIPSRFQTKEREELIKLEFPTTLLLPVPPHPPLRACRQVRW